VAAGRAGAKAAGVVIDDAAVTPNYVTGFTPDRELPIIARITVGSLKNKLIILLPAALLLSAFVPWAITPILMLGGLYLSYEGAEKVVEKLGGEKHGETLEDPIEDPAQFEKDRVGGAIRTDLILSAEIMAITLASVADQPLLNRALVLAIVGAGITFAVYGAVALIVKMDDIGLHLAKRRTRAVQALGRALVRAMPGVLTALSTVGVVAMMWVGGGIVLHGLEELGAPAPASVVHHLQEAVEHSSGALAGALGWLTYAGASALFGLALGSIVAFILHKVLKIGLHEAH
jgi:predicted DNA repair protein MutK